MSKLEELVRIAEEIKKQNKRDSTTALELCGLANEIYGTSSRDPEFIRLIQLSSSIREKEVFIWGNIDEILNIGVIKKPEEEGYFFTSAFGLGKVEIYKNRVLAHRMYGISLQFSPGKKSNLNLPSGIIHNFEERKDNTSRLRRGRDLLTKLEKEIAKVSPEFKKTTYPGILMECALIGSEFIIPGIDYLGKNGVLDVDYMVSKIKGDIPSFEKDFAEKSQNIHHVASVNDGGSRYKR